jgi:preprotein translocase subunit SecB
VYAKTELVPVAMCHWFIGHNWQSLLLVASALILYPWARQVVTMQSLEVFAFPELNIGFPLAVEFTPPFALQYEQVFCDIRA